jgi:hypothetical protein
MAVRYSGLARARIGRNGVIPDKHFEQNTEGSLLLFVEYSFTLHSVFSDLSNNQCD